VKSRRVRPAEVCWNVIIGALVFGFGCTVLCAATVGYPNKPINVVVPLPPGGVTDLSARLLGETMEKILKQTVVIVNKPGGASTIGGYAVASAKPDGYTLGFFPFSATAP